ncbi:hypothetical protein BRC68_16290 [Halobacteriales archaeon QH_6_64_20]|nr:MAG: hypothetical protein BRC68_16290 [Halobacteriales archaeon QH_6_64_20]
MQADDSAVRLRTPIRHGSTFPHSPRAVRLLGFSGPSPVVGGGDEIGSEVRNEIQRNVVLTRRERTRERPVR